MASASFAGRLQGHGGRGPPLPKCPLAVWHSEAKQNGGSAACRHRSQTREADVGAKGKAFSSGASQPGRMADSHLKDHLLFLLRPEVPIGRGRGGLFSVQLSPTSPSLPLAGVHAGTQTHNKAAKKIIKTKTSKCFQIKNQSP